MTRPKRRAPAAAVGPAGRPGTLRAVGVIHVQPKPTIEPEGLAPMPWYVPTPPPWPREDLRLDRPTSARLANLALGGKDHLGPDRTLLDLLQAEDQDWTTTALRARQDLHRVVRRLAEDGLDQFVDLGCGLTTGAPGSPLAPIHTSILPIRPTARIAYVDIDPMVMTHARALLHAPAPGQVRHIRADLTAPEGLLQELRQHSDVDWQRPIAVVLADVLHELSDPQARGLFSALRLALPQGSALVLTHRCTGESDRDARVSGLFAQARLPRHPRGRDAVDTLLDGWQRQAPAHGGDTAVVRTVVAYGGTK
ncbi:hypothetical protein GCM10010495_48580 [Kitasatospora herbaricolor]|uniref:SAM-dependent methyltransferase n=1 Tax=Kitasatospora herbaricolor TaxID=68217 RepID=UPI0017497E14|nr:SAM-dependent methyltransferase [Kitasatospora herbaricolor]MDQ0305775.1 hypothetical protein [Kitasatospora herbaricolor]GGV26882.1 hypothetical protein GCM10010495_48580 [Kitasatospora herbaricolor]